MNLYFAGSQNKLIEKNIRKLGCLRLWSYFNDKSSLKKWFDDNELVEKYNKQGKQSLNAEELDKINFFGAIHRGLEFDALVPNPNLVFLDSGAYTSHTKGVEINVDDYIEYINKHDKHIQCCAQLDKIPGRLGEVKTNEDREVAAKLSWENYLYMVDRVKTPEKLIPIFHQGEDFRYLKRMLDFEDKISYIGISPSNDVSTNLKEPWIEECLKIIKTSKNPDIKTHAFGMTALKVLETHRFFSADSTTWLLTGAMGGILTKWGTLKVSNKGRKDSVDNQNLEDEVTQYIENLVSCSSITLEGLREDYAQRMLFNIFFLLDWLENYNYSPKKVTQNKLF